MDHGKPLSVVAVCVSAKLVLYLMCLEVGYFPYFQDVILRHG